MKKEMIINKDLVNNNLGSKYEEHILSCASSADVQNIITDLHKTSDPRHTLVIFDADETLIRQKDTHNGSHEWFTQSIAYLQSTKGLTFEEARILVIALRDVYHHHNELELADAGWPALFDHMDEHKIGRIVLTRRTHSMADLTSVWFDRLNLTMTEDYFGENRVVPLSLDNAALHRGKVFCGNNTKGDTLFHFMKHRHETFPYEKRTNIILIDDRDEYLSCVSRSLAEFTQEHAVDVAFYGIHFTALHEQMKGFLIDDQEKAALDRLYEAYSAEKMMKK